MEKKFDFINLFFKVAIGLSLFFFVLCVYFSYKQLKIKTQVLMEIEYCNGKIDTIFTTIDGESKYLFIQNNGNRSSVPELKSFNHKLILLNVCSFKILNENKIEQ